MTVLCSMRCPSSQGVLIADTQSDAAGKQSYTCCHSSILPLSIGKGHGLSHNRNERVGTQGNAGRCHWYRLHRHVVNPLHQMGLPQAETSGTPTNLRNPLGPSYASVVMHLHKIQTPVLHPCFAPQTHRTRATKLTIGPENSKQRAPSYVPLLPHQEIKRPSSLWKQHNNCIKHT